MLSNHTTDFASVKPHPNYHDFEVLEKEYLEKSDKDLRQLILRTVVDYKGDFTGQGMTIFLRKLRKTLNGSIHSSLTKKQYTVLKYLLKSQLQYFDIDFELKSEDTKPSRLEIIPTTAEHWTALPHAQVLLDCCRNRKLRKTTTIELATRLTYELMAVGYGFNPAVWIVTALKVDDLLRPNIAVPSRPGGLEYGFHEFLVSDPISIILKRLHQIRCGQKQTIRFQPTDYVITTKNDQTPDTQEPLLRFKDLKILIEKCHLNLLKEISGQPHRQHPLRTTKALEETFRTLSTITLNLESAYALRLSQLPFPNDAVDGMSRFIDFTQLNVDYKPLRAEFCIHSQPTGTRVSAVGADEESLEPVLDFDNNWRKNYSKTQQKGAFIIRRFIAHLQDKTHYSESSKLQSETEQATLTKFTDKYLSDLDESYRHNISVIAIRFMVDRLMNHKLQIKTAVQNLQNTITHGALRYEDSDDLRNWDEDDIHDVMDYIRHGANGSPRAPSTVSAIQSRLMKIFIFAQKNLQLLLDIPLVNKYEGKIQRFFRNDPWTPGVFESHYAALGNSNRPDKKREQMMMALAYWGGMRPKEIRHLSLISIETCFDEINLYIRSTKTVNGRRRIPLHLLAPDTILEDCRDYIRTRRKEAEQFTGIATKQIALIGFKHSPHALRREVLTDGITQYLRERGGDHMDLYGLRHSFASLNLLRWQVYTAPDTLSFLRIGNHPIFKPPYDQRFAKLFSRHLAGNNEREKVNTLIQIRRLMGHGHLSVTLENYTHCFGALIAIRRAQAQTTTL